MFLSQETGDLPLTLSMNNKANGEVLFIDNSLLKVKVDDNESVVAMKFKVRNINSQNSVYKTKFFQSTDMSFMSGEIFRDGNRFSAKGVLESESQKIDAMFSFEIVDKAAKGKLYFTE